MKNLLNISDISKENLNEILEYSKTLDQTFENSLEGKNIGLIFEKSSTRTRLSFQVGINQLKGNYIDIRFDELNLKRFESYEDTFEIMSCYLDCLVFRTTDHKKLELAQKYFKKPIINALSDISHPCQAISDIYTLKEIFGTVDDLNVVWMGDMNNVLFSLIEVFKFLNNSKIDVFTDKKIFEKNKNQFNFSKKVKYHFELNKNIISSAHCIMTDVFTSMNDKENKETLLSKFQVNKNLMDLTNQNAIFMHCLPAKIGSEVTDEVIKGEKSIVIEQAKNKLVAQRGILKWLNT